MQQIDIFESWVEIGMIMAAVIGGISLVLFPYIHSYLKNKKTLNRQTQFDWNTHNRLHEVLTELRVQSDCARTQIVQFHNGGEFLDGISMQKMSLTHESLASGTSSEIEIKKDIHLSLCIEGLKFHALFSGNNILKGSAGLKSGQWLTNNMEGFNSNTEVKNI